MKHTNTWTLSLSTTTSVLFRLIIITIIIIIANKPAERKWGMNEWMTTLFKGAVSLWNVLCNLSCNVLVTLWRDRLHETISQCRILCNGQNHCEKSCTKSTIKLNSVFGKQLLQLISLKFWPLQGILHCEMFCATCSTTMSPKHETFHRVTAPQVSILNSRVKVLYLLGRIKYLVNSFQLGFSKVKKIELKLNLRTYLLLNAIPINYYHLIIIQ